MATIKSSKARKSNPARKSSTGNAASSAVARPRSPTIMNSPVKAPVASYVSMLPADAHPDIVQLAQRADELTGATAEAQAKRAERERQRAEEEAHRAAGITLKGARLQQAQRTVAQVNFSAATVHRLAFDTDEALGDVERMTRYLTALGNVAETICRRCDVLAELLGDRGGFGNFADEFEAITPERAAELDREEAEAGE